MYSCAKDGGYRFQGSPSTVQTSVIPLDEALSTLKDFLGVTKGKIIDNNQFSVKVVTIGHNTKSHTGLPIDTLLYCVDIADGGSAVLSANTGLSELIYAVTDSTHLDPDILRAEIDRQIFELARPFDPLVDIHDEGEMLSTPIDEYGDDIAITIIASTVARDAFQPAVNELEIHNSGSYAYYRPLLKTKWDQGIPFDSLLTYSPAGCTAIAAAQVLLNLRQSHPETGMTFCEKECTWTDMEGVCNITDPSFRVILNNGIRSHIL